MLEKWKYSGLSQQAFSSREGIDVKRLIYWKRALIDRGLFTDRVSVSKVAKSKKFADKNPEEAKLLPVNIMATEDIKIFSFFTRYPGTYWIMIRQGPHCNKILIFTINDSIFWFKD